MNPPNKDITVRELQEYIRSKDHKPGLEHGYFMKLIEEIGELADHPFMVGSQFHPELKSRPTRPHPLFQAFIAAAAKHQNDQEQTAS